MSAELWFEKHQLWVTVGLVVLTLVCTIFGQDISGYVKGLPGGFTRARRTSKENTLCMLEEFERDPRVAVNRFLKNVGILSVLLGLLAFSTGIRLNGRAMHSLAVRDSVSFLVFETSAAEVMLECLWMLVIAIGLNLISLAWRYRHPAQRIASLRVELGATLSETKD